ncbi:MAG: SMI1/KNR4 family protein [Verrucomicrobiaceae bacterium]|nr:MAG: SMI1/KNR4 family protein [Verrucomicrobiaceae bacterium]
MNDWRKDLLKFHQGDNPDDSNPPVFGPPATPEAIAAFEKSVGLRMPQEFHELYLQVDGFGQMYNGEILWYVVPLAELAEHVAGRRDWFQKTHPDLARGYVPFFDWANGDSCGYLFSKSGAMVPGLFMFEHEEYEFEEDQDPEDFLSLTDESFRHFIRDIGTPTGE